MAHETIHGHTVKYEDEDRDEIKDASKYLENHISRDEAEVYFNQAKSRGDAQFEDHHGKNYTLRYRGDGIYKIERR